jgi:surface antigen
MFKFAPTAGLAVLACGLVVAVAPPADAQLGVRVNPAPITNSLNVLNSQVSRSVNQLSTQVSRGLGQVNTSVNRGLNRLNSFSYQPPLQVRTPRYRPGGLGNRAVTPRSSYYAPQTLQAPAAAPIAQSQQVRLSEDQINSLRTYQQSMAATQAAYGILPPEILTTLTDDQLGLQNAAQRVALDGEIGEIIDWTYEGVSGSVTVKSEHTFGTMRCRDFTQTISRGGETVEAQGTLCERGAGQWARSTF